MDPQVIRRLFNNLNQIGYVWWAVTPDRLLKLRKDFGELRPIVRCFGLGLPTDSAELLADGLAKDLLPVLVSADIGILSEEGFRSSFSISGQGDLFVLHDHWPPAQPGTLKYIHCGAESWVLARFIRDDLEGFIGRKVLDLGSGCGVLAMEVAGVAAEVLGLEISGRAATVSQAVASAYNLKNVRFEAVEVGEAGALALIDDASYDIAIFNPPMVVPEPDIFYPHKDGGDLGIELPLKFLEFARVKLKQGGEVFCLATNPFVKGGPARGTFLEKLRALPFEVQRAQVINSHFNQSVARKNAYADRGIERVELLLLHLKKN